jgi:protein-S-isoprenylcysteine O-methyltransferase Ste14
MTAPTDPQKPVFPIKALIAFGIYLLLNPIILFVAAGTTQWPMGWVYSIATVVLTIVSRVAMIKLNPDLAQERGNYREAEGVKPWDRVLSAIVGLYGNLAILIVAGFDYRYLWSPEVAVSISWIALAVGLLGFVFGTWALIENRFFSAVVRIQTDRGHTVCDTGPYKIVRHPGYSGAALFFGAMPVILGTLWAYIPVAITLLALIIRTALEDKTLQAELEGYKEFAQTTRYRLLPFIW